MDDAGALQELILDLIKALLQTGTYSADHPQAARSHQILFETFQPRKNSPGNSPRTPRLRDIRLSRRYAI